jgi:3-isopropylmalate dehydrogenase
MMLRYSFGEFEAAAAIEAAVEKAVTTGTRTGDIAFGIDPVGTKAMGAEVLKHL